MTQEDPLYETLLATAQDSSAQRLAARYVPILRFDANEPFLPLAVGYTIIRADGRSPSTKRRIVLSTPEHPRATQAIEYAFWWDWDIGHLYELEQIWVYLDGQGQVISCEASWHGAYQPMALADGLVLEGDHVIVYSEPGKHAFAPDPAWFGSRWSAHRHVTSRELAGSDGVLVPDMFAGKIARTPWSGTLVRTYLAGHGFEPSWDFSGSCTFEARQLVPWPTLRDWIPQRVAWWIDRLARETDPATYRTLSIGYRSPPAGALGNTLTGFRRAAAHGVDLIGIELYITVDGAIVASHAPFVHDVDGQLWSVASSTLDELRALDLGEGLQHFPELEQICATCNEERVGLYAEIKDGRALPLVLEQLRAGGLARFTIVGAYRADWLADSKALAPDIATAIQFDSPSVDGLALAQSIGANYVFPCWAARDAQQSARLTVEWVAKAHAAGKGVIGWHTDRPEVRAAMQQIGLDALCSVGSAPVSDAPAPHRLLAICIDCGDTLVDEATEIKDTGEATLRATLIPGASELVRELANRGYRLALVADGPAATFLNVLTQHRLYDYFDVFAISDHVGYSKPDRRIFVHALDQLGIEPADYGRTLMIGNYLERDIKGANELGMISVWLDWSPRRPKVPANASEIPRYTIKEPLELLRVIDELEGLTG